MKIHCRTVVGYIIACTVFSSLLTIETGIGGFEFYYYPIMTFLFFIALQKRQAIIILFYFILFLLYQVFIKLFFSYPLFDLFKQFIPIVVIYIGMLEAIRYVGVKRVFDCYLNVAIIVSVLGCLQFLLYCVTKNDFLSPYGYRVSSITTEPSHLAIVLMPAFVYKLKIFVQKNKNKIGLIIVFVCILLTQSLTVFACFIPILLIMFGGRAVVKLLPVIVILSYFLYNAVENDAALSHRYDSIISLLHGSYKFDTGQETVYSALTNIYAAICSLDLSFGFGVGLGGHPHSYDICFADRPDIYLRSSYGINKLNGHSLLIRLISEFGYVAIFIMFYLLFKVLKDRVLMRDPIFISCMAYIFCRCIKLGGYFDHG
ncbi:TPA: hypothetical protein ACH9OA_004844, partial [Escherichia coli]